MTTAQTEGIITKLINYKCTQRRLGNYDLVYKLTEEEAQDLRECRIDGKVPAETFGIKLEIK